MLVNRRLAGKFLEEHKLPWIFGVVMKFVDEAPRLHARRRDQPTQEFPEFFFMAWNRLEMDIQDYWNFCHGFPYGTNKDG